jgi:hypothetical protein
VPVERRACREYRSCQSTWHGASRRRRANNRSSIEQAHDMAACAQCGQQPLTLTLGLRAHPRDRPYGVSSMTLASIAIGPIASACSTCILLGALRNNCCVSFSTQCRFDIFPRLGNTQIAKPLGYITLHFTSCLGAFQIGACRMKARLGMFPSASAAVMVPARRTGPAESQPGCPPIGRRVLDRLQRRAASGPFTPECVKAALARA